MSLLQLYEQLQEQEMTKAAEAEDLEVIYKYAEAADYLLSEEFGNDYTEDDVAELATKLIEADIAYMEDLEKVAELEEAGAIMARAFLRELGIE